MVADRLRRAGRGFGCTASSASLLPSKTLGRLPSLEHACTRSQSMVEGNRRMLEARRSKETPRSSLLVGDCTRWVLNSRVCTCLQIGNCHWSQELGVCLPCLVK